MKEHHEFKVEEEYEYQQIKQPNNMIKETFDVSISVPRRTKADVLVALMEEVGELATEISVDSGYSTKPEGKDGIVGEAIDIIICALDMIWVSSPNTTEAELEDHVMKILRVKLEKWKEKTKQQ